MLDSHAVDRSVTTPGGPALFIQVKGHQRRRRDGRVSQAIPLSAVGDYEGWVVVIAVFCAASGEVIEACWVVRGSELTTKVAPDSTGHISFEVHAAGADPRWLPSAVPTERARRAPLAPPAKVTGRGC